MCLDYNHIEKEELFDDNNNFDNDFDIYCGNCGAKTSLQCTCR